MARDAITIKIFTDNAIPDITIPLGEFFNEVEDFSSWYMEKKDYYPFRLYGIYNPPQNTGSDLSTI